MMEALSNLNAWVLANWCPSKPDLNIIEMIWVIMKRRGEAQYSKNLGEWRAVLIDVWNNSSLATINGLVAQIPARLAQVTQFTICDGVDGR
jgi:hypothetical protein